MTAADELVAELEATFRERADALHYFDHEEGRALARFLATLDAIDRDLAIAAADPQFSLELCIACWEHDWNRNGRIDDRDRKLFEIEYDGHGGELARRRSAPRPTFRFDVGDVDWARAMIAFQRAGAELVLAYRWSELDKLFAARRATTCARDPARSTPAGSSARASCILAGLDVADACREEYLAETDDDREWVPNPRQKSHPIPLEVDDAALPRPGPASSATSGGCSTSEEGISMREAAGARRRKLALLVPDAYIDVGKMLDEPQDIVLDLNERESDARQAFEARAARPARPRLPDQDARVTARRAPSAT